MPKISIAIIAHNEARNLPRALGSVQWADEIVVVDTSSTDETGEIARRRGAKVAVQPNLSNLNVNKNYAIDFCCGDWILILDADEVVPDLLAGEIRRALAAPSAVGYDLPRRNFMMGKWLRYGSQYPDYQRRLFQRGKGRFAAAHIHERLTVNGKVGYLEEPLEHYPYITIESLVCKGIRDVEFEAEFLHKKGKTATIGSIWLNGIIKPSIRFVRRYIFKGGFLDGTPGLVIALFDAWNTTQRWLRLWEKVKSRDIKSIA